jgi:hypothetical protein
MPSNNKEKFYVKASKRLIEIYGLERVSLNILQFLGRIVSMQAIMEGVDPTWEKKLLIV